MLKAGASSSSRGECCRQQWQSLRSLLSGLVAQAVLPHLQMFMRALAGALLQAGVVVLQCLLLRRPARSGCYRMSWPMNSQQQQMTCWVSSRVACYCQDRQHMQLRVVQMM